jgi:uncharacterized protein YggE
MFRKSAAALSLAGIFLATHAFAQDNARPSPPTVTVVGEAEETTRPDIAILTLHVTGDRPTANDASNENARVTTAVIDGLKTSGVDAKDISTVAFSLTPLMVEQRDPKTNQVVKFVPSGFRAANTLQVKVREIDRAGAFIAASVQNGALYQGIAYDLSDREAREDKLRVKAVENATHRASLLAEGAHLKLGALRSLSDVGGAPGPQPRMFARAMIAAPEAVAPLPIEPGEISLSQSVNGTFELTAQ